MALMLEGGERLGKEMKGTDHDGADNRESGMDVTTFGKEPRRNGRARCRMR